jgi:ribonuclease BN (tRNA processing enzyme)
MIKLHLLGTGGGLLCAGRNPSAYLLETDEGHILFDCGDGVALNLVNSGYDWRNLLAVVISHTHADHLGGFPLLIQQIYLSRRKNPLYIYGPEEFIEQIYCHLGIYYLFPAAFSFDFKPVSLELGESFIMNEVEIFPVLTKHLERAKGKIPEGCPNRGEAFAFIVKAENKKIFYSADLQSFEDIHKYLEDCHYVLIETTHIDIETIFEWAEEHQKIEIIVTHISPGFDVEYFNVLRGKNGITNINIAKDGNSIDIR